MSASMMEELLECKVCNKRLQHPKMLSCQHTFCLACLQGLLNSTSEGKQSNDMKPWSLPAAYQFTALPLGAVASSVLNLRLPIQMVKGKVFPLQA